MRWWRVCAFAYLAIVLWALLWPSGSDIASAKDWLGPWFLDAAGKDVVLNLAMLAPLTFAAARGWPSVPWWKWVIAAAALSAAAECAQWLLPELSRRGSVANVAQNTAGATLGALLAHLRTRHPHAESKGLLPRSGG